MSDNNRKAIGGPNKDLRNAALDLIRAGKAAQQSAGTYRTSSPRKVVSERVAPDPPPNATTAPKGTETNPRPKKAKPKSGSSKAWPVATAFIVLIIVIAVVTVLFRMTGAGPAPAGADPGAASSDVCNPIEFDQNANFSVLSKVTDTGHQIETRDDDLAAMKKDPRNLEFRAWTMRLWPQLNTWQSLVKDNCLSQEGVDLFNKVRNVLLGKDPTVKLLSFDENAEAPADYINSGMENGGGAVINATGGISGDRSAIRYTIQLAGESTPTDFYVLKRCGNPVFKGKPNLPERVIPDTPHENPPNNPPPGGCIGFCGNPPPQVCDCDHQCVGMDWGFCNPPVVCTCEQPCGPNNPSPESCQPQCPNGLCKNYNDGPESVLPPDVIRQPLPLLPDHRESDGPEAGRPDPVYTPPANNVPVWKPPAAGGPSVDPAPKPAPPVETGTDAVTGQPGHAGSGAPGTPSSGNGANGANDGDTGGF